MIGAKGEPVADRSARVGRPYRLVLYRPQHATSSRATAADDDDDDGPPVAVEGVEDLVRWGTPVVWFRLPEVRRFLGSGVSTILALNIWLNNFVTQSPFFPLLTRKRMFFVLNTLDAELI